MTGDLSAAHQAGIGAGTGAIGGYISAQKAGLNPWTGRPNNSITIAQGQGRVDTYARDLNSETISESWPADVEGYFGKEIKYSYTLPEGMKFNAEWIELKIQSDYYIYYIGPKGSSVQSPYYNMEIGRTMVYPKVYKVTHIQQIKAIRILTIHK